MKKLAVYMQTTSGGFKNQLMKAFAEGVRTDLDGWEVIEHNGLDLVNSTHALCFNYQRLKEDRLRPGLKLRCDVWDKHKKDGSIWFYDGNIFVSYEKTKSHPHNNFVRIPYSNVYTDKAKYFNENPDPNRWQNMMQRLQIQLRDYNKSGDKIILCCNRGSGGYSGLGVNAAEWAERTVRKIRRFTDRPIIIRQHHAKGYPAYAIDTQRLKNLVKEINNVELQNPEGHYPILIEQIRKCYAVVVFTSSAGAPAVIEGKPLYVEHHTSFLYPMNAGDLSTIENPNLNVDRQSFLNKLGDCHYSLEEIKRGVYWKKVKQYV